MRTGRMLNGARHSPGRCVDREMAGFGCSRETNAARLPAPESRAAGPGVQAVEAVAACSGLTPEARYRLVCP
jgi:hypothetical protein